MDYAEYSDYAYETTTTSGADAGIAALFGGIWLIVWLAIYLLYVIAFWKMFVKAKIEGWKSLVPIYNMYLLCQLAGRPGWWLLLMFIPGVEFIIWIILGIDIAKSFGKDEAFGIIAIGLFRLIGILMLGFGSAQYKGPSGPEKGGASKPPAPKPAAA